MFWEILSSSECAHFLLPVLQLSLPRRDESPSCSFWDSKCHSPAVLCYNPQSVQHEKRQISLSSHFYLAKCWALETKRILIDNCAGTHAMMKNCFFQTLFFALNQKYPYSSMDVVFFRRSVLLFKGCLHMKDLKGPKLMWAGGQRDKKSQKSNLGIEWQVLLKILKPLCLNLIFLSSKGLNFYSN